VGAACFGEEIVEVNSPVSHRVIWCASLLYAKRNFNRDTTALHLILVFRHPRSGKRPE